MSWSSTLPTLERGRVARSRLKRWLRDQRRATPTSENRRLVDGSPLSVHLAQDCSDDLRAETGRLLAGYPETSQRPHSSIVVRPDGDTYRLSGDNVSAPPCIGCPPQVGQPASLALGNAQLVLHHLEVWLAERSLDLADPSEVRIHGGAVVLDGRTWLIVGGSHAGKSTLVLDAVQRGGRYLTDERISLHRRNSELEIGGLTRPIHIRSTKEDIELLLGQEAGASLVDVGFRTVIPREAIERLGGSIAPDALPPGRLIILTDEDPISTSSGSVSPGWVALQLLSASMDVVRSGESSLGLIGELVVRSELAVRAPRTLTSATEIADFSAPSGGTVRRLEAAPAPGYGRWAVAPQCTSVAIGDEVVIWIAGSPPMLLLLREERAAWWMKMSEGDPAARQYDPELVADLATFGAIIETIDG